MGRSRLPTTPIILTNPPSLTTPRQNFQKNEIQKGISPAWLSGLSKSFCSYLLLLLKVQRLLSSLRGGPQNKRDKISVANLSSTSWESDGTCMMVYTLTASHLLQEDRLYCLTSGPSSLWGLGHVSMYAAPVLLGRTPFPSS